jgi:hypothetical protein
MKKYEVTIFTRLGKLERIIEADSIEYKNNSVIFYTISKRPETQNYKLADNPFGIPEIIFSCPAKNTIVKLIPDINGSI